MKLENTNNSGVSPVVGVILVVAITVLLSSVIGAFVLDLGQSTTESSGQQELGIRTTAENGQVTVQVVTGAADSLELRVDGVSKDSRTNVKPGDTLSASAGTNEDVVVVATTDGQSQVVSTKNPHTGSGTTDSGPSAPTDGLIAYYNAEGTSSSSIPDETGTFPLTNDGVSSVSGGPNGDYLTFDGTADATASSALLPNSGDPWTVSMWVRTSSTETQTLWSQYEGDNSQNNRASLYILNEKLAYEKRDPNIDIYGTTNLVDGNWHHIVATRESDGTLTLYVDATSDATGSDSTAMRDTAFQLGVNDEVVSWTHHLNADTDEIRVYDRALSPEEVETIHDSEQ